MLLKMPPLEYSGGGIFFDPGVFYHFNIPMQSFIGHIFTIIRIIHGKNRRSV